MCDKHLTDIRFADRTSDVRRGWGYSDGIFETSVV